MYCGWFNIHSFTLRHQNRSITRALTRPEAASLPERLPFPHIASRGGGVEGTDLGLRALRAGESWYAMVIKIEMPLTLYGKLTYGKSPLQICKCKSTIIYIYIDKLFYIVK